MNKSLRHLTGILSISLGMRLFSMSIIIPFLSSYALNLEGGTPVLTGYALGIFGLTQAIFQIPLGALADKIGFKKVMIMGLVLLIAGLITAALTTSVCWLVFARALQGSGAIVTVGYSWISSVSSDSDRDRELTRLGAVIGFFTMLSYTIGPLIHIFMSISQMFFFSAFLIFCCMIWVITCTHQVAPEKRIQYTSQRKKNKSVFNRNNFSLGLMLTINSVIMLAFFFMLSLLLNGIMETKEMWKILTPSIIIAVGLLPVFSKLASRSNPRLVLISLFLMEGFGFAMLFLGNFSQILIGTAFIMTGSFAISTIIPMLANRNIENSQRGKGNGVIISLQYLGSFLGAIFTGYFWNISELSAFIFVWIVAALSIFLIFSISFKKPINNPLNLNSTTNNQK